jgi:glycosyltransferase involved in cell wall biosynthesis
LPAAGAADADMTLRIGFLVSHPIQYYTPIFRELAKRCDLTVYFAHRQTAEQQARAGFGVAFDWDIDLLSGYRSQFLTNVSRKPSTDRFWGCDTPDIAREIAEGRFDAFVVPGWALWSYWQAVRACRRAGVPVFVRGDSQLVSQRDGAVRVAKALAFPYVLRRFDGFLHVGQRNRDYLLNYGAPPQRLFFSPHCVDNSAFRAGSEAARRQAASVGATRAGKRILFVGKLIGRKRPFDLLQAAVRMRRNGMPVEMAFAGSGELAGSLEQFAKAADLPVQFHGFVNQSEMPAIYAFADAIVLPSDGSETWGLAINEAMACGVPAVVSDAVGCGPDLIEPGATGATFPLGDIPAMAKAIETVLFSLDTRTTRDRLAARLQIYSPARAAEGIMEGAISLCGRLLLN